MEIVQYLENFNLISIILRMTLATLFGGLIGLDRAAHGQSAGIRTFALVCLGSSMVMITNEYLFTVYGNGDPARLAAQVIRHWIPWGWKYPDYWKKLCERIDNSSGIMDNGMPGNFDWFRLYGRQCLRFFGNYIYFVGDDPMESLYG